MTKDKIKKYLLGILRELHVQHDRICTQMDVIMTESAIAQVEIIYSDLIQENVPDKKSILNPIDKN